MDLPWHLYLMAFLYILAGLNHFRNPKMYVRIIPPYFPNPKLLNILSGLAEICFGLLLCLPDYSTYGACGIIFLLIVFLPAHIHMLQDKKASFGLPKWVLILRIPLQFLLIYWAYLYI
ncbi:putative membrane protein [Flavobacterium gossypii]|jgi:Predicted membrane protein|uniref:Membrane protein n=1 Tax=Flavobacterium gossypii TaxID=1646119 RepID=A0ABR6DUJ9_9FLAO|nr:MULTISPECIES: MauE/DoxX family redox-associated membrane protein [Flavobacterium]MBA9074525.1 putative membrane protein [Flavobacterium gossypii]WDO14580.1 DoxX family membrane protein [Flavobacterium sp. WW92]